MRRDVRNGDAELRSHRPQARRVQPAAVHQHRRTPPGDRRSSSRRRRRRTHPRLQHQTATRRAQPAPARSWCATTAALNTRLWAAFNPGVAHHKSGVEQFVYPTTTGKWSRFVPLTSSQLGNSTGVLLGFNKSNALNSAVLVDLPGTARRNHNPCLVCGGAPGYGKSYAAKRLVRAEIQRGAQAFIVDPTTSPNGHTRWPTSPTKPSSTWAATNSAAARCASSPRKSPADTGWTTWCP